MLGTLAALQDDFARAEPLFAESLALARDQGYRPGLAQTLRAYGQAALDQGDGRAAALIQESLALARELASVRMTVACPEGLPSLHAPAAPEHAARLLGTAAALRERIGVPLPRRERPRREKLLAALHTALGDDGVASAEAMGRTTPLQTATAEMLDELPSNGSVAPEPERVSAERAE